MSFPRCIVAILAGSLLFPATATDAQSLSEKQRVLIGLETLSRIEGDPRTDPVLQQSITNILRQIRGTPEFVQIVKKFNVQGQAPGLIEIAIKEPASEWGVEAIRLVLNQGELNLLEKALQESNPIESAKLVEALGNTKDQRVIQVLSQVVNDPKRDLLIRKMGVRALVQTSEGATALLQTVRAGTLPGDLRLTAGEALHAARWSNVKTQAEELLPLPKAQDAQPLPPLAELVRMKGNVLKGEKVYFSESVACSTCHKVRDRGVEIGPNLSEIGGKLAREALFEAILDPSAGISCGYEAHQIELKSGDEAYGLLASETEDEIAVKDLKGIITKFKKADVASRKQLNTSIMPTGLAEGLSPQELVDLVEFLGSLQKL